jgi:hypothetical protein
MARKLSPIAQLPSYNSTPYRLSLIRYHFHFIITNTTITITTTNNNNIIQMKYYG